MPTNVEHKVLGEANNIDQFIAFVKNFSRDPLNRVVFRGQSNIAYNIEPSVLRDEHLKNNEGEIVRELMSVQPDEFSNDKFFFDVLVRCQHYGLPTRLLDVSLSPLIGLFLRVIRIQIPTEK